MIIGVTGGTGFIGQELVKRHIDHGDSVRVLSRSYHKNICPCDKLELFQGDLTGAVGKLKPFVDGLDVLYHCAAEIKHEPNMAHVHIRGTENLSNAAAAGKIKHWVQLSSVGVYGRNLKGIVDENHSLNPVGTYEKTKMASENIVKELAGKGGFTWSILRPSNVYGPEMSNNSLFQLISAINMGYFFFIGKKGARANYVHVNNVVDALLLCGQNELAQGKSYNLNDSCSMEEFVNNITRVLCRNKLLLRIPLSIAKAIAFVGGVYDGFPLTNSRIDALSCDCEYSIERIQNDLGFKHQVSLEKGLLEMVSKWRGLSGEGV